MRRRGSWIGLGLAGGLLAAPAMAQTLDTLFAPGVPGYDTAPGVTVASRVHPEQQPPGVSSGAFIVHPVWEQGLGGDSNVLGGPDPVGSWIVATRPSVLVSSDWPRDALGAFIAADDRRDLDAPAQSRTDWTASLGASLDIGRDRLTLGVAQIASHEDRTALDALPTDRPVPFQVEDVRAAYAWTGGRWTITPSLEASAWRYGSTSILGVPASQAYRDRTVLIGGTTIAYELAPQRSLVLVTRAIAQDYAHPLPDQPTLDSTGYQVLTGVDEALDDVWRYRLLLGAEHRDFAAAFPPRTAAITEAEITWLPSGMTTISADVTRRMEDAAQEGVAGYTLTSARMTVEHELRRNLVLHASAAMQRADFLQGGTWQAGYALELGATWLLTRQVNLSATYDLTGQHGSGTTALPLAGDYVRSLGMLTLRLAL